MNRYDLNGLRLKLLNGPHGDDYVYLVLDGQLHFLDHKLQSNGIFANWADTWTVDASAPGLNFEYGESIAADVTCLAQLGRDVYLQINGGHYRHINNPDTFNRFGFNWDAIRGGYESYGKGDWIFWQPGGDGDLTELGGKVYLSDEGRLRHVVEVDTYQDLFGGTGAKHRDPWNEPFGADIDRSVKVIKAPEHPELWLLDDNRRRLLSDHNVFRYYGFDRGVVHTVPYWELIEHIEGRPIVWPTQYNISEPEAGDSTDE